MCFCFSTTKKGKSVSHHFLRYAGPGHLDSPNHLKLEGEDYSTPWAQRCGKTCPATALQNGRSGAARQTKPKKGQFMRTFHRGICPEQKFNVNRACFPKGKTPEFTKKWAKFMNFSFWPFLWFGLPGRLVRKNSLTQKSYDGNRHIQQSRGAMALKSPKSLKKVFPGFPACSVKKASKKSPRTRKRVENVFGGFVNTFSHSGLEGPGRPF